MTVYVCGASGYIGSNLLAMYPECSPVRRGEVPYCLKGDAVINLAAYGHQPGQDDLDTMVEVNTLYPIRLRREIPRSITMVQACSSSERDDPGTQYAKTKSLASRSLEGKATLAYIYTPFGGINEPLTRFMAMLVKTAREGGVFHVETPGAMRDLIHVRHVCKGLMRLAVEDFPRGEAHLGGGQAQFHDVIAMKASEMAGGRMAVTRGGGRGKILYPAPNPYIPCDPVEDLRGEICG